MQKLPHQAFVNPPEPVASALTNNPSDPRSGAPAQINSPSIHPIASSGGGEVYALPRLVVHEDFPMSFGFAVKVLRDERSGKVLMMFVDSVDPDSDARRQGLEVGMRIMVIEGRPVTDYDASFLRGSELNRIFSARSRGAVLLLQAIPPGSQTIKSLRIVERPFYADADNWVLEGIK